MINSEGKNLVVTIADVMTPGPVTVLPDMPLAEVVKIFAEKNYSGIPVVSKEGVLAGIITQYDLVTKGSGVHIPTLVKTLEEVKMLQPEKLILEETLAPIKKLKVKDVMNSDPLFVRGSDTIESAVMVFAEHHKINPILVVDETKKVIGVLSRHDLIKILAMKELGKAVGSAIERQRGVSGSEGAVASTMKGVRSNFLFMPKYKTARWVAVGFAIFVIGLVASFLLVVKVPDNGTQNPVTKLAPSNGQAEIYLKSDVSNPKPGQIIPVDIYAKFSGEPDKIAIIVARVSAGENVGFIDISSSSKMSEFKLDVQLYNLKSRRINLSWNPPNGDFIPLTGKEYYLGTVAFVFNGGKTGSVNLDFASSTDVSSFVTDEAGNDILKGIGILEFGSK